MTSMFHVSPDGNINNSSFPQTQRQKCPREDVSRQRVRWLAWTSWQDPSQCQTSAARSRHCLSAGWGWGFSSFWLTFRNESYSSALPFLMESWVHTCSGVCSLERQDANPGPLDFSATWCFEDDREDVGLMIEWPGNSPMAMLEQCGGSAHRVIIPHSFSGPTSSGGVYMRWFEGGAKKSPLPSTEKNIHSPSHLGCLEMSHC